MARQLSAAFGGCHLSSHVNQFAGSGGLSAAHFTRGEPTDLRARIRRRAALRDGLILLGLIVALVAGTLFGVTRLW
jgi:hypothetical protein